MADDIRPFRVEVPEAVLDDLRDRLGAHPVAGPDPRHAVGLRHRPRVPPGAVRDVATTFDWRAQEARFNRWPHFLTDIDGQQVHFIHAALTGARRVPAHHHARLAGLGLRVPRHHRPAVRPAQHGGDPADAFHVVCPSIPGYGWSGPTREPGWDVPRVAQRVEDADGAARLRPLRRAGRRLGRDDLAPRSRAIDDEHVVGLHTNMLLAFPRRRERHRARRGGGRRPRAVGEFMTTRQRVPGDPGQEPADARVRAHRLPAGLAGWIVEKFYAWTDHDGDLETR